MFFVLSQLISWIISPLSQIILLFIGLIFSKTHKRLFKTTLIFMLFFYTSPLTTWIALKAWEIPPVAYHEIRQSYDLGIVLCGISDMHVDPSDRPHFNYSADRITDAVVLYKKGTIKKILLSGGSGYLGFPELKESHRLKEFLINTGVNEGDIIIEDRSNNTRENAQYSAEIILRDFPNSSQLLITSAGHMRRAYGCFSKVGLNPDRFSSDVNTGSFKWSHSLFIPNVNALLTWTQLIKEWVGYVVYWLIGYL